MSKLDAASKIGLNGYSKLTGTNMNQPRNIVLGLSLAEVVALLFTVWFFMRDLTDSDTFTKSAVLFTLALTVFGFATFLIWKAFLGNRQIVYLIVVDAIALPFFAFQSGTPYPIILSALLLIGIVFLFTPSARTWYKPINKLQQVN